MILATITRQILLLVVGAVMATTATFVTMALYGPPPVPAPVSISRIADALKAGSVPAHPMRSLNVTQSASWPASLHKGCRDAGLERAIAKEAGLDPRDIAACRADTRPPPALRPPGQGRPMDAMDAVRGDFTIARRLGDGADPRWLIVRSGPDMTVSRWRMMAALAVCAVLLIVTLASWFVARRISRPLRALATAAGSARAGIAWPATATHGATREVREVADALAIFDARHRDHFRQQTAMLASIAHDLGTPLARLAFRIDGLPEAQRQAALADIEQMRRLVADGIALARGEVTRREPIDLTALTRRIAHDAGLPDTRVTIPDAPVVITGEAVALERLVQNIIDNGERHGKGASVILYRENDQARLVVEDNGPGIPTDILAIICDPFVRGTDGQGSGLGLAIARTVAERHGGSLSIRNRAERGVRVDVLLPLASQTNIRTAASSAFQ